MTAESKIPMISGGEPVVSVKSVCVSNARVGFNISANGDANLSAGVIGRAKTSKIAMKVMLQKYDATSKKWNNVKVWNNDSSTSAISFSEKYSLKSNGTYRCKMTASVLCNGTNEMVTKTSSSIKF